MHVCSRAVPNQSIASQWSIGKTGRADEDYRFLLAHARPDVHSLRELRQMAVARPDPVGVTQLDEVAVAVIPAGDRDDAVGCRADRRAVRGRVIRALVCPPALQNRMIAIAETARDMAGGGG